MWPKTWFERPSLAAIGALLLVGGLLTGLQWASGGKALIVWGVGILAVVVGSQMTDTSRTAAWVAAAALLIAALLASFAAIQ